MCMGLLHYAVKSILTVGLAMHKGWCEQLPVRVATVGAQRSNRDVINYTM
jgi:hypothetical protein